MDIQPVHNPSEEELERYRAVQSLSYQCAETIAGELKPGMTEREVAGKMKAWLLDHGVEGWFHQPFAWFGDRTAFRGLISLNQLKGFNPGFYPGFRKLEENMPYILDCAPVLNGAVGDIGYVGCLGENAELDELLDNLMAHRNLIVNEIRAGKTMAEVSQAVDRLCEEQGVEPRHKAYPFEVLSHRVEILPKQNSALSAMHFGVNAVRSLLSSQKAAKKEGWSPLWNSSDASNHPPIPGMWAVEPHLGKGPIGAKFEELLVITDNDAYWLDDDVPHVRRWKQRSLSNQIA